MRTRLCRFPLCRLRLAQGLSEARRFPSEDAGETVDKDLGPATGVTTTTETAAWARLAKKCGASASLPFSCSRRRLRRRWARQIRLVVFPLPLATAGPSIPLIA